MKTKLSLPLFASVALAVGSTATVRASVPPTLLDLAHASSKPSRLAESVVIIIDAQREYVDGRLPLAGVSAALAQTQRLLVRARAAGVPIIHIQQVSPPGRGLFDPNSPSDAIVAEATPSPNEIVIPKKLP